MEFVSNGTPRRRPRGALILAKVIAALALFAFGAGCGGDDDPVDPGDDCPPAAAKLTPSGAHPFQEGRVVLIEHFTNDLCTPCAPVEAVLQSVIESRGFDRVVTVGNHLNYPNPNDPVYLANAAQSLARGNRFGVASMPSVWVDGVKVSGIPTNRVPTEAEVEAALIPRLDEAEAVSAEYDVEVMRAVVGDSLIITTMVTKRAEPSTADDGLVVIVTESDVIYRNAENVCIEFTDAVRRYVTSVEGDPIDVELDQTETFRHALALSGTFTTANLDAVAFVQAAASKIVRGTGSTH
jgi:hypothetical protein